MSFSKKVKNGVKKAVSWIGDFEQTAAELAIEKKYDYVICGHIHQPQKREIITEKGKVTYLNSGDWIENLTALEYHGNDWTIYHYDEKAFSNTAAPVVTMEKRLPKLNVIPEEVLLFASKLDIGNAINLSL
jgi:DNA repair exonuclease SbcCD nuclease subunit